MKRVLFAGLLMLGLSTASFSGDFVAGGKTHSTFGDYKIEVANTPVILNGEELKSFTISYDNSPLKVTVAIQKTKKCKNYIVLSDKLAVQYVCNGDYFGVQKLDKALVPAGFSASDEALNKTEYFRQKLLVWNQTDELANTQLIAAYFPMLVNDEAIAAK
jgi:hypothetical protein